jgi:FixJ family two-component response regulator
VYGRSHVSSELMPQPRKPASKVSSISARLAAKKSASGRQPSRKSSQPPCIHLVTDTPNGHQDFVAALADWPCRLVPHASAYDALANLPPTGVDCIVIFESVAAHGRRPKLFETLIQRRGCPPIVFLASAISWQWAADVVGRGAVDILPIPLDSAALINSLQRACVSGKTRNAQMLLLAELQLRRSTLTPRQSQVLDRLMAGSFSTRELGAAEQRTERTIENHRNKIMRKLGFTKIVQVVAFEYERKELERLLDAPPGYQG